MVEMVASRSSLCFCGWYLMAVVGKRLLDLNIGDALSLL
jgi:hypothetical protein